MSRNKLKRRSNHFFTRARLFAYAAELDRRGEFSLAIAVRSRIAPEGPRLPSLSQPQKRKNRRRAFAAGDHLAFSR